MANLIRRRFFNRMYRFLLPAPIAGEEATLLIKKLLKGNEPCMISRFGSTELQTLTYIKFFPLMLPFKRRTYRNIQYCSGFFPVTHKNLRKFYQLYKSDVKSQLDALVSWRFEELFFKRWIGKHPRINKQTLDYFFATEHPWTQVLEGKRILVVHPFAETIIKQYETHRKDLFSSPEVLPKFKELHVIKAVQSVAANPVDFDTWFDALEHMKRQIDQVDFDIALLGCGAYGMPLAAHIKRMGRKAVHLGGITQILFGIKGRIYVESEKIGPYINEYFVYPDDSDRPKNAESCEGGCYWR